MSTSRPPWSARALTCLAAATDHPDRRDLADEVHARPFLRIDAPARVTHLALLGESTSGDRQHEQLIGELCTAIAIPVPPQGARHYVFSIADFQIKWERHTEFSTITVVGPIAKQPLFESWLSSELTAPTAWTTAVAEKRLVALQIEVLKDQAARQSCRHWFSGTMVGSRVLGGGEIWGDWRIANDGFTRFLVLDLDFRENQVGRLVQRLAEIETYRMMATLALPVARTMLGRLESLDAALGAVTRQMIADPDCGRDAELLLNLTDLAGQVEALSAASNRFSAAQAYDHLVQARIHELREERIEGVPTIGEFMERRLSPAMDSCRSVRQRQADLAARIARAIDLLRTRVNLVQERQVTELLAGMNRTATTQLKLQRAVEGLSVVAISYYAVSLIAYLMAALHEVGWSFNSVIAKAISIPLAILITFLMIRGVRRRISEL